jgi:hypothetical protein
MRSPRGVPVDEMIFLDRSLAPGRKPLPSIEGTERILQTGFIPYYFNETNSIHIRKPFASCPVYSLFHIKLPVG